MLPKHDESFSCWFVTVMVNALEGSGDIEVADEEMAGVSAEGFVKSGDSVGVTKSPITAKAKGTKNIAGWNVEAS